MLGLQSNRAGNLMLRKGGNGKKGGDLWLNSVLGKEASEGFGESNEVQGSGRRKIYKGCGIPAEGIGGGGTSRWGKRDSAVTKRANRGKREAPPRRGENERRERIEVSQRKNR